MKFKYTALNPDNKETTGILEAPNVEAAKKELHQMNLSILVINKISEQEYQESAGKQQETRKNTGIITYIFKAQDAYQKVIDGTIDAKDAYSAFKRLIINYHFQVLALHPKQQDDLDDTILQTNFKADSAQWKVKLKEEGIDLEQALRVQPVDKDLEGENEVINKKIAQQIDQFIIQAKGIIKVHSEHFSVAFLEEINNKLANLERIRASNNLDNITRVSNELYELLNHPDRFASLSQEKQQTYNQSLAGIERSELIEKQYKAEQMAKKIGVMKGGVDTVVDKLKSVTPTSQSTQTSSVTDWRFLANSFWLYLKAPRGPLKEARYEAFKSAMEKRKAKVKEEKKERKVVLKDFWKNRVNRDYEFLFQEINGFVGWLLAFYILYLFLVSVSLERGVGLSEEFVLKTLEGPLIVNVTLFLVWLHLILKVKLNLFHKQFLGSFLLFVFAGATYGMVVVNF